jgi:hypothetical protein
VVGGKRLSETLNFEVEFFEADIEVDAILSYPWMSQHQIGIFPHHRALAKDQPIFTLLYGKRNWRANEEEERETCDIETRVLSRQEKKRKRRRKRRRFVRKRNKSMLVREIQELLT